MSTRLGDRIAGLLLLGLAVFVYVYSGRLPAPIQDLDPGVGYFPRMLAVLIGVLALVPLLRPQEWERMPRGVIAWHVLGTAALLFFYALAIDTLGFVITTVVFVLAELLLLGARKPLTLVLMPLGVSLGLFYLFRSVLDVPLPTAGWGGLPI
ncbi:tripartite tricarboxylate transporter TctB family protein [uncultured Kocuria sp.]|uniref:tripartite tricarboxylate transporter TctB family protein n=1 Tax=uncultured Kocuria sp. TaxID=259305 RepID=UPI00262AB528|nr:tripartite tricarboxylate transporter TctB family protein [uncultured Kocuria sp.]